MATFAVRCTISEGALQARGLTFAKAVGLSERIFVHVDFLSVKQEKQLKNLGSNQIGASIEYLRKSKGCEAICIQLDETPEVDAGRWLN